MDSLKNVQQRQAIYDTLKNATKERSNEIKSSVGAESYMNFPSKTFKIHPMFRMLFHCCIDVVSEEKSPLTQALLEKEIGVERANKLRQHEFNHLFAHMVKKFSKAISESSYDDISFQIRFDERYAKLIESFRRKQTSTNLTMISFRIPDTVINEVRAMKRTKLGEVVELAIAWYALQCDELTFDLIYLAFEHYEA